MIDDLTSFQKSALVGVREALGQAGRTPDAEEIAGNREKYLLVTFSGYRVLIYADGAEVLGHELDRRLEKEDFRSLDELQAQLVSEVRQLVI